jgi:hypothetical protein
MRKAELHKKDYEALKSSVLSDLWFLIKDRADHSLDISETKGIPAIVFQSWEDGGINETLDEIFVQGSNVYVISSCPEYNIEGEETDIEKFEVPFLIEILASVEKHLAREEE